LQKYPYQSEAVSWSEAFEQLEMAVAQLSLDGTVLTVNEHLCELIGHQKSDLLGRDFREFLELVEPQSTFEAALNRLAAGEIRRYSTSPPMTTVASGLSTSPPREVATAIGINPRLATSAVINTGRRRSEAP
jgi:PAS domain-containing protein